MEKYKIIVIILLFAGLAISNGAMANQQLITFDSLNANDPNIPIGYAGMTWDNIEIINATLVNPAFSYYYGAVSLPNEAFTTSGGAGSFSDTNPFTFNSIYLTIQIPGTMLITGSLNGVLEYSELLYLNWNSPTLETLNWTNINKVTINATGGWNVSMDNILITTVSDPASTVPEPASIALLASGLFGFAASRRKKIRA